MNKKYKEAVKALGMKNAESVRFSLSAVYYLNPDILTKQNLWNVIKLYSLVSRVNTGKVCTLCKHDLKDIPGHYTGKKLVNALEAIVVGKLRKEIEPDDIPY